MSAHPPHLVVRGRRVVTEGGTIPAAVHVRSGIITAIAAPDDVPQGVAVVDAGDSVVMPGLVDTHVHVNEPGRTEWEGFDSATRAAAAGGVTTLLDMPLNSIPATTTLDALHAKRRAAEGRCWVDVGFLGGVVPGNAGELRALHDAGVFGFKCFLVDPGVAEFARVTEADLDTAMPLLSDMDALLMAHAELAGTVESAMVAVLTEEHYDPRRYTDYMRSRPREAESEAVDLLIRLAAKYGTRVHVVHLSSTDIFPVLSEARERGVPVSAETCPHYLHFTAEEIPDGATEYKCAPPIRDHNQRESLWEGLEEGLIEMVVSDHSPCPPQLKTAAGGDFLRAWGGIASLQLGLSVVWRQARSRGHGVERLVDWMSAAPARLVRIDDRKGAIATGRDADLVIWNPDAEYVVEPGMLHHRHKHTPYLGCRLPGAVESTFVHGERVYHRGAFADAPVGRLLSREYRPAWNTP